MWFKHYNEKIFVLIIKVLIHVNKWACISTYDSYLDNIIPCWLLVIFDSWNLHGHHWVPIFSYTNSLGQLFPFYHVLIPQAQTLESCRCGVKGNSVLSVSYFPVRNVYINWKEGLNTEYQHQITHVETCLSAFSSIFTGWHPGPGSGKAAITATFRISLPCL